MGFFVFQEAGLIANPHYLTLPKPCKFPEEHVWIKEWFSLRDKLVKKGIDIPKVDEIIRSHHNKMNDLISEWIAAREVLKKLVRDPSYIKSKDEEKLPNELVRPLLKIRAKVLRGQVSNLVGSGGLRKLTRKNVRSWPVFTLIITDLHEYLIQFFKKPIPSGLYSHEFLSRDAQKEFHPEWTTYPEALLQVIASLLQVYYPLYFSGFTANHVKSRVKIYAE